MGQSKRRASSPNNTLRFAGIQHSGGATLSRPLLHLQHKSASHGGQLSGTKQKYQEKVGGGEIVISAFQNRGNDSRAGHHVPENMSAYAATRRRERDDDMRDKGLPFLQMNESLLIQLLF
jgi:hypothetical protein